MNIKWDHSEIGHRIIVALLVFVLLACAIVMVMLLANQRWRSPAGDHDKDVDQSCQFSTSKPNSSVPKQVASQDFRALASFSGYLKLSTRDNSKEYYLALELAGLATGGTETRPTLDLLAKCATIKLTLGESLESEIEVRYVDVALKVPWHDPHQDSEAPTSRTWETCSNLFPGITYAKGEGFTCRSGKQLKCLTSEVVVLVIDSIAFEMNGDPNKIRRHEYSKPLRPCDQLSIN